MGGHFCPPSPPFRRFLFDQPIQFETQKRFHAPCPGVESLFLHFRPSLEREGGRREGAGPFQEEPQEQTGRDQEREESIGQRESGEPPLAPGAGRRKPGSNGSADEGRGEATGRPGQSWEQDGRGSEKLEQPQQWGAGVSKRTKEGSKAETQEAGKALLSVSPGPAVCPWASYFPSLACLLIWKSEVGLDDLEKSSHLRNLSSELASKRAIIESRGMNSRLPSPGGGDVVGPRALLLSP